MTIPIIFTLNDCPYCFELKKTLSDLSIPFHDVEITKNKKLWDFIVSQTEQDLLPTVLIHTNNQGDGLVYVPERDFQDLDEIIEIIKKNI